MKSRPRSADLNPGPGFRVRRAIRRPKPSMIDALLRFDTPDLSDLLNRMYTMDTGLHRIAGRGRLAGPACTVKVFPGDNLMVHKVLDIAQPGDVVVIDAGRSAMNAVLGDIVTRKAKHRGIAGFVIDGLIRDVEGLDRIGLPIFARGRSAVGPLHRGPGEINFEVSCGGIVVIPGDAIVADGEGIVVIRHDIIDELVTRATDMQESFSSYLADVERGIFSNDWVDRLLGEAGVEPED